MQWEYMTKWIGKSNFWTNQLDVSALQEELKVCGERGWELVCCNTAYGPLGQAKGAILIFKKSKS